jgi:hypothetical protein
MIRNTNVDDTTNALPFAKHVLSAGVLRVLLACEESQTVTKAFRKLGHEAYSCDIQECSGGHPEWHYTGDVTKLLKQHWDIVIAFPPCTYMTNGGAVRMYPKKGIIDENRYQKAMEAKEFFMLFYNLDCKHVAIENPMPMNIIGLPKYSQIIQPYMFGDGYSKKTCLWLKNLPPLYHNATPNLFDENVTHAKEYQPYINGGGGRLDKPNYKGKTFANGSKKRSKFFQGVADAMAEQWAAYACR